MSDEAISEVYRIRKRDNNHHTPTETDILTFGIPTQPKEVKIGYENKAMIMIHVFRKNRTVTIIIKNMPPHTTRASVLDVNTPQPSTLIITSKSD